MRVRSALLTFSIALLVASTALPSFAATPAMEACSAKWADLKTAGKTKGQTWPEFWSKCSKDFAGAEPAQPEKATSKKAPEKSAKTDFRLGLSPSWTVDKISGGLVVRDGARIF